MGEVGDFLGKAAVAGLVPGGLAAMLSPELLASKAKAKSLRDQGEYIKDVHNFNADIADINAQEAITKGDQVAAAIFKRGKQLRGAQRAAIAAGGGDVGFGVAADIQAQAEVNTRLDMITVSNNAWREAWGFRIEAATSRLQGVNATIAAENKARTTLITGGLSFAKRYYGGAASLVTGGFGGGATKGATSAARGTQKFAKIAGKPGGRVPV